MRWAIVIILCLAVVAGVFSVASSNRVKTFGGLHIEGNHFADASGSRVTLRGAVLSLLEYSCSPGDRYTAADYMTMQQVWGMNAVKIPVNPRFWTGGCDANYHTVVANAVAKAEAAGLYVLLSGLEYNNGGPAIRMPSQSSVAMWNDLGTRYANDDHMLFELFSEPHDVSWQVWRDGDPQQGYVGMQTLVDTVNAVAPHRIVLANGMPWGGTLFGIAQGYALHGRNLGYSVHFYTGTDTMNPANWPRVFGDIGAKVPVVAAEFGDINHCDGSWLKQSMPYMAQHTTGYFAWAWSTDPNYCKRPSLIANWNGTPTPYSVPIYDFYRQQAALAGDVLANPPTGSNTTPSASSGDEAAAANGINVSANTGGSAVAQPEQGKAASSVSMWWMFGGGIVGIIVLAGAFWWRRRHQAMVQHQADAAPDDMVLYGAEAWYRSEEVDHVL